MDTPPYTMKAGTLGGTLLVIVIQIQKGELIKTAILASIGAVVSFGVTTVLRWVMKKVRRM
jgi:mannitol-specific phosphotransferase system IIBC component